MGHHHQSTPVGGQPVLQPGNGTQVEVIGGLVEYQQLGRVGQHPGQGHPFGLPARELGDVGVGGRTHAQALEGGVGLPTRAHRGPDRSRGQYGLLVEVAGPHPAAQP